MGITVFHQGSYEDGALWYTYWNGTNWEPDTQVPGVGMSASPSAVALPGGGISVFHQGSHQDGSLWYAYYNGIGWEQDTLVPNVGITDSPSAVAYAGGITVFHQGYDNSGQLWGSYFKAPIWGSDTQVPNVVNMSLSPSAVVFPGTGLTVFHSRGDEGGYPTLWYTSFDGTNWTTPDLELPFILLGSSPSAVLMPDGGISVFYQGSGTITAGNGQLWCAYFDGKNRVSNTQVPGVGMSGSPSAVLS